MTIVAKGKVSKAYLEIDENYGGLGKVTLCLDGRWFELTEVSTSESSGFTLPEPLGCECFVTDISDRHWGNKNYEIEYASSYSRDGAFWAKDFREVAGI